MKTPLLLFIVTSFLSFSLSAQWITFRADNTNGITTELISSITQSFDGNIWFASDAGLVKYDTKNGVWNKYTTANGLGSNFCYDVKEDKQHRVWAGTNGGVSKISGNSIQTYNISNSGLTNNIVRALTQDNQSNLWFATYGGGICKFNGNKTWEVFNTGKGLPTNYFYSAFKDSRGFLWFGTNGKGVLKYDGSNWINFTTADGLAGNTILHIEEDSKHRMLFAGSNGVSIYNDTVWQTVGVANGLAANLAYSVTEDSNKKLRIGTDEGMNIWDGQTMTLVDSSDGLADKSVYCIFQDSKKQLWLGHLRNGASHYDGQRWLNYNKITGLKSNYVYNGCEDKYGNMWFSTSGGISKYDGLSWKTYSSEIGIPYNYYYYNIAADSGGNIWASSGNNGLVKYDGSKWTVLTTSDGLWRNNVSNVFVDSKNRIWVAYGNYGGGVSVFNGTSWKYYAQSNGDNLDYVTQIFEDSQGTIWFIHNNRISNFNGNKWSNISPPLYGGTNNNSLNIYGISQDKEGDFWFPYSEYYYNPNYKYERGVMKYDGKKFVKHADFPLGNLTPQRIFFSSLGDMWLGGNNYYNSAALCTFDGSNWKYYYVNSNEIASSYVNRIFEDSHKNLWICTNNGISRGNLLKVGFPTVEVKTMIQTINNYPNPFSSHTSIQFTAVNEQQVQLCVYDINGKMLRNEKYSFQNPGLQQIDFNGAELSEGIYLYKLILANKELNGKMILIK